MHSNVFMRPASWRVFFWWQDRLLSQELLSQKDKLGAPGILSCLFWMTGNLSSSRGAALPKNKDGRNVCARMICLHQ